MEEQQTAGHFGPAQTSGTGRVNRHRDLRSSVFALILTSVCYLYWSLSGSLYTYLDNMTVSMVSGGMFGNRFFCQYLHPLLSCLIYGLSRIMPFADVFALLVHIALFGSVYMLSRIGIGMMGSELPKSREIRDYIFLMLVILSVLFFAIGMNLWGVNYTVQTAAILFAGLVTLSWAGETEAGRGRIAAGTLLIAVGFMIRSETALLFIPFIGLELLTGILNGSDRKAALRKALRCFGAAVLAAAVLLVSRGIFNSFEPYASDNRYTEYRTVVEDYPMGPFDPAKGEALGIDEATYSLVSGSWVLLDTERIDTETLKGIAEIGGRNAFEYDLRGLLGALREMARRVRGTDIYLLVLTVMTVFLSLRNAVTAKSKWLKAEAVLALLGGFVILLYFTFRGRALFRVWQTVLLAVDAVLVCNTIHVGRERAQASEKAGLPQALFMLVMCALLYYAAGQMLAHTVIHPPITPLTSRWNADDSAYAQTWENDGLYIWSNWYLTIPIHFADQNKLPTQRVVDHNIPVGDWTYGQVYFREFLAERNADNPAAALLERPNTFLMEGYVDELTDYLRTVYGGELVPDGEVNGVKAYRAEKGERNE